MNLVGILIALLVLCLFLWILHLILDLLIPATGLPAQVKPIILAIVGLIAMIYALRLFGVGVGF